MGPPTISADQLKISLDRVVYRFASMGPPTISADQQGPVHRHQAPRHRFNGAADDLGGSTSTLGKQQLYASWLQWGRRRSRRINGKRPLWRALHSHCFNGAADDLGGSTTHYSPLAVCVHQASMGPPTISADQQCRSGVPSPQRELQWGRRRSRRINSACAGQA